MSADRILVRGIEAFGYHGVLPEERERGQPFVVDLLVQTDASDAAAADDLAMTVDYALLAQDVVSVIEGEACDLIETVAVRIADRVLTHARVQAVEVTVHKPQAPVGVAFADVAVIVERGEVTAIARAALGLGSNLGDRRAFLDQAIRAIESTPGITVVGVSPVVESSPVGGPPQQDYLNAVVVIDTVLGPGALLDLAQRCEDQAGRERRERWGPRTLDVDVLAYGGLTTDDPVLTLPHPRAVERAFVLVPWAVVDPHFVVSGRAVSDWAADVDVSGVRPADPVREG